MGHCTLSFTNYGKRGLITIRRKFENHCNEQVTLIKQGGKAIKIRTLLYGFDGENGKTFEIQNMAQGSTFVNRRVKT